MAQAPARASAPRWALHLERLAYLLSALLSVPALVKIREEYTGSAYPVRDEASAEWRAREARLLRWGMPQLGNCTAPAAGPAAALPAEELPVVHVVYSGDAKVFSAILTSMLSLSGSLAAPESCAIHLVVAERDMAAAAEVVECFKRELSALAAVPVVHLHTMQPLPFDARAFDRAVPSRAYERSVPQLYVRWYLHEYLPGVRRAIWLDADTVVRADLGALYRIGMARAVAAVPEGRYHFWRRRLDDAPLLPRAAAAFERLEPEKWFNPGVLLIDLERWKLRNFTRTLEDWLELAGGYMGVQMALNLELRDDFQALDWSWNLHSLGAFRYPEPCLEAARVLHAGAVDYDLFDPWECHALALAVAAPHEAARQRCPALRRERFVASPASLAPGGRAARG